MYLRTSPYIPPSTHGFLPPSRYVCTLGSNAYNLVLHKHAELLYQGVQEAVQSHLREMGQQVAATPDAQVCMYVVVTCFEA